MFKTRLISGIVLVVIVALILFLGGSATCIFMCALSILGVYELLKVYELHDKLLGACSYVVTVVYYGLLFFNLKNVYIPVMLGFLLLLLAIYVITFPKYKDKDLMMVFLSFFYVSVMLSYVFQLRELNYGGYLTILIFICSWGNDTMAYVVGVLFGKHKMSPELSPKKSIEGLIGGIVGAGLIGVIYGLLINRFVFDVELAWLWFGIIGALGAVPAVIGDLAASAIKRNNDIKDYGNLIPGHGGIMDRFDSMIFTAPIIYYLIIVVTKLGIVNI